MFKIPEILVKKINANHNEVPEIRKPAKIVKFVAPIKEEPEEVETNTTITSIGREWNCINTGVIFGEIIDNKTDEKIPIASVTFSPNDAIDSSINITVMDKNNNIIAETDDIGLVGIAVKGHDDIKDLTGSIGSLSACLISEFDNYYHRKKTVSTRDYWKKFENK